MNWDHILLDKKDWIATITLNRPDKLNAFAGMMRQDLEEAVKEAVNDRDIRVIVITGAGKAFCVGADIDEAMAGNSQALSEVSSSERPAMDNIVLALNTSEKPVIAAVNGMAAGGGCNLTLACDIRIASEKARFGQVFTRRGVIPDWGGMYFLPRLVGYAKAAELIFSGEVLDAQEALKIGMVNKIVPHEALMSSTYEMAERMAKNAPIPIALAKRALQNFYKWDLPMALDYELYAVGVVGKSEDLKEGFQSFLEKREPVFKGR